MIPEEQKKSERSKSVNFLLLQEAMTFFFESVCFCFGLNGC